MTSIGFARTDAAAASDRLRRYILAAQRGDQEAFQPLYQEYGRPVFNLVYRCLRNPQAAEDICQEIWVKAFRELPKLQDPQAFPAWLYRIAARASIDAARKNNRVAASSELSEERLSANDGDPEVTALRREKVRLTWEAMATIPARQHVALYLREIQNMSYKEIAQMLGTSQSAVEMLLFRARQGFAKAYERLEAAGPDRCQNARRSMSAILDGEGTRVQQNAIRAHADACLSCSGELAQMRRTAAAFSALLPLPVPALLSERIFESIGAAAGAGTATAAPTSIAKIITLAATKAKVASITLVATAAATTAATVASMNTPIADEFRTGPASSVQETQSGADYQPGGSGSRLGDPPPARDLNETLLPGEPGALVPIDPNLVSGATTTVDGLAAPVTIIVNQTTTDLNATVDSILHNLGANTGALPTAPVVPPLPIEAPVLPESPLPTLSAGVPTVLP